MSFFNQNYRQKIIVSFTFLGGLYFFLSFILPPSLLESVGVKQHHEDISLGFVAIGLLTFGLGIINLFMIHGGKLIYLKKGWSQSLALIAGLVTMVLFSALDWREDYLIQNDTADLNMLWEFSKAIQKDAEAKRTDVPPAEERVKIFLQHALLSTENPEVRLSFNPYQDQEKSELYSKLLQDYKAKKTNLATFLKQEKDSLKLDSLPKVGGRLSELMSQKKDLLSRHAENSFYKKFYQFLFEGLFVSLGSALFSLLGVYIAAAAYRAFRIKTWESSLMMLAAFIVMLGQISFGSWLYADMPAIRGWLLEIPSSATSRAIGIGASVAGLVLAFRMWFSIESDSFSKKK